MSDAICPYCLTRPVQPYRGMGRYPVHCGDNDCRLARKRETRQSGWNVVVRDMREVSDMCPHCTSPLAPRRDAKTCGGLLCRRQQNRQDCAARQRARTRRTPRPVVVYDGARQTGTRESDATIEQAFQQARAARLARERATGVREHSTLDGWAQKSGGRPYVAAEGEGW